MFYNIFSNVALFENTATKIYNPVKKKKKIYRTKPNKTVLL